MNFREIRERETGFNTGSCLVPQQPLLEPDLSLL